jgi:hypothetical protein
LISPHISLLDRQPKVTGKVRRDIGQGIGFLNAVTKASEAVKAADQAIHFNSNDAGLYANLAIAFLISGENDEAERSIEKSIEMAPDDEISKHVHRIVKEVVVGKRKQSKTMSALLVN